MKKRAPEPCWCLGNQDPPMEDSLRPSLYPMLPYSHSWSGRSGNLFQNESPSSKVHTFRHCSRNKARYEQVDEGAAWSLGDETAKVAKSEIPPMVAASRWAAGGAWNVALANHDTFPLGENCAYGGRGFGRGVLLRPLISDIFTSST